MDRGHVILAEPYNGGLAAARSLVRAGLRPTLVLTEDIGYMARSRGVRAVHVRPEAGVSESDALIAALVRLADEGPGLVITGADRMTELLAQRRGEIPAVLRTFEGPDSGHLDLIGKDRAYEIARAAGVAVPWSSTVSSREELRAAAGDAPFPCIVKPELSHEYRPLFGDERVFAAADVAEAEAQAGRALDAGIAMMLSELVPGGDEAVEEAIVVRTRDGDYPVRVGCRKIRQYPPGFGAASLAVSDPIPESMELARAVLDEAGFVGVVGVETKRHAVTGRRYFLEANVRLPTQWGLGDASGADASRRTIAALAGEALPPQPQLTDGVKFMFPELELRAAVRILRESSGSGRFSAGREVLRAWSGTRELGVLNPRDPGPGAARIGYVVRKRLRRLSRD